MMASVSGCRFDPNAYGNPLTKPTPAPQSTVKPTAEQRSVDQPTIEVPTPTTARPVEELRNVETDHRASSLQLPPPKEEVVGQVRPKPINGLLQSKFAPRETQPVKSQSALDCQLKMPIGPKSLRSRHLKSEDQGSYCTVSGIEKLQIEAQAENVRPSAMPDGLYTAPPKNASSKTPLSSPRLSRDETNVTAVDPYEASPLQSKYPNTMAPPSRSRSSRSHPTIPQHVPDVPQYTKEELLDLVRQQELQKIQTRNKGRDKQVTTSLRDLDLARKPLRGTTPPINVTGSPDSQDQPLHALAQALLPQATVKSSKKSGTGPSPPRSVKNGAQLTPKDTPCTLPAHDTPSNSLSKIKQEKQLSVAGGHKNGSDWQNPGVDQGPADSNAGGGVDVSCPLNNPSNPSQGTPNSGNVSCINLGGRTHPLVGWDGKMQPPPTDWDDRPRHNSIGPNFQEGLAKWNQDVYQLTVGAEDAMLATIPHDKLKSVEFNPDGISMVPKGTTVNKQNANRYGYHDDIAEEALRFTQPFATKDLDDDWGKLDTSKPENVSIMNETTNDLVANWTKNTEERRKLVDEQIQQEEKSAKALLEDQAPSASNKPALSIYLRPACGVDINRMTVIYNWHIKNSPRPAETVEIEEDDMQGRLDSSNEAKLPFIVAVQKASRSVVSPSAQDQTGQLSTDAQEKVVGWACAQDFTAMDFVERISVELEIYVHPAYRQLGVGKCLLDQLLQGLDRGYTKQFNYHFRCPQEYRHLYTYGGGRDLHKLTFILRKWKFPQNTEPPQWPHKHIKGQTKRKVDDREDDYDLWLKKWLESWGFEVEGVLKGAGAKNGRFVDIVHLGKETRWQPLEGKIPDPIPVRSQM